MSGIVSITQTKASDIPQIERMLNCLSSQNKERPSVISADGLLLGRHLGKGGDSTSGRYSGVLNGVLYNRKHLQMELSLKGDMISDTDVLLAAAEQWGMPFFINRLSGAYSIILYDRKEKKLLAARDRVGEKPLFYSKIPGHFAITSGLRALKCMDGFPTEIDEDALFLYLQRGSFPTPYTVYKDVFELPAGHYLSIKAPFSTIEPPICYWNAQEQFVFGQKNTFPGSLDEAADALTVLLEEMIRLQTPSVGTTGALLSGGIDSSLISAVLQSVSERPIKTFCIGFEQSDFDETKYAKQVSNVIGSDHTEVILPAPQAKHIIDQLPQIYDGPMADGSQIATYWAIKIASASVSRLFCGDGGDELFCGYKRFFKVRNFRNKLTRIPWPMRKASARLLRSSIAKPFNRACKQNRLLRMSDLLMADGISDMNQAVIARFPESRRIAINGSSVYRPMYELNDPIGGLDIVSQLMLNDFLTSLPNALCVKTERASSAIGIDLCAPLLDNGIIHFSHSLPLGYKYQEGQSKMILRKVLSRYIPQSLIDRPKMGFRVPIGTWLRAGLREWAEDMLSSARLSSEGFLNAEYVQEIWKDHLIGRNDWTDALWTILSFEMWMENEHRNAFF